MYNKHVDVYCYCCILAVHSAVHVSAHNQSLIVFDEVSSKSASSRICGHTWYHSKCKNKLHYVSEINVTSLSCRTLTFMNWFW